MKRVSPDTLRMVHDDEDLVAVDKPPGLATVSERWNPTAPTVLGLLWRRWQALDPAAPRPHVVHRLDKDTSGVLLFARHRAAQVDLRRQFRARSIEKSYLAVVLGVPDPAEGTIEISIEEDPRVAGRMRVVRHGGKSCQTAYAVIERFQDFSLLRLRPRTGRTHQIRVSLQSIGHPCAVDPLYGGRAALHVSEWVRGFRLGKEQVDRALIARVTLHAERLALTHPRTGAPLIIEAELPKDLQALLRQLRKWRSV